MMRLANPSSPAVTTEPLNSAKSLKKGLANAWKQPSCIIKIESQVSRDMSGSKPLQLPGNIPWQHWVERWDRMQERYLVRRTERIRLLVDLVRATVSPVARVLDLGCGTGSLMQPFLDAFPNAEIYGVDFDPVLLPLAQQRLRVELKSSSFVRPECFWRCDCDAIYGAFR